MPLKCVILNIAKNKAYLHDHVVSSGLTLKNIYYKYVHGLGKYDISCFVLLIVSQTILVLTMIFAVMTNHNTWNWSVQ